MDLANKLSDALSETQAELAEANRKLKNYEPIALYNGKGIEQYAAELTACKASLSEASAALENIRARCEWVAMQSGDLLYIKSVAENALALKPSDASTTERGDET